MKKILFALLFLIVSYHDAIANVASPDKINTVRLYKLYWIGIHVADLKATFKDDGVDAVVEPYGIVKKVSEFQSTFKAKFNYVGGEIVPLSYYTESSKKNRKKSVNIKYNEDGYIVKEDVNPPLNRDKRAEIDSSLKQDSVDPLTAFIVARQKVKENLAKGNDKFKFKMYDGTRLVWLDFNIEGQVEKEINGVNEKVIKVTFRREPIKGFTNKELRRMKKQEPKFTLYFSDDKQLRLVKVDADAPIGAAVMLLDKECSSMDECV